MSEIPHIKCNLCGLDNPRPMFTVTQGSQLGEGFQIVQCPGCSLIFMSPRPSQEYFEERYSGNYSAGYIDKKVSKQRRAHRIVRRITRYKKNGRFLDIGCSAGFVLEAARAKGFEVYGVEISPLAIRFAREELQLDIKEGYLETAEFPSAYFDVITLYHVIEHVDDPVKFFQEVRRILKPDGLVEIWTPDIGHFQAKKLGPRWKNFISDHLYYFDIKTLAKMLEKTGLMVYKNQFTFKDGLQVYAKRKN